jgi:hypothetical protein
MVSLLTLLKSIALDVTLEALLKGIASRETSSEFYSQSCAHQFSKT